MSISALSFPEGEESMFTVGAESGDIYESNLHGDTRVLKSFSGHTAPVTSLSYHPKVLQPDIDSLFATSSIDWSVKLWVY